MLKIKGARDDDWDVEGIPFAGVSARWRELYFTGGYKAISIEVEETKNPGRRWG